MSDFIKLLIYKLRTVDGKRDTAVMLQKKLKYAYRKELNIDGVDRENVKRCPSNAAIEYEILLKIIKKYILMRVRMKLSFIAFQKGYTYSELWAKGILSSYHRLQSKK